MAKDKPQGSTVQYKVLLKPTDIGLLVMGRLRRPHLDMSTELRRLIELGYAAEQAGFILDGTALRHAGRMWDIQPDLSVEARGGSSTVPELPETGHDRHPVQRSKRAKVEAGTPPGSTEDGDTQSKSGASDVSASDTSKLRSNLRNLSS